MSKGRLTRQELSWLLTQEAQNAAERLRSGVKTLRTQAPPAPDASQDPTLHLDASLDALDDVMKMLSNLNQRSTAAVTTQAAPQRRGRIDVAALLVEIAPDARVSIEPGSGTEVYGDEADLRRMLQVLVGHGSGEGASAVVRREGDDVRVSVTLGPDSSPTAETERAWLSRMVVRYGGRHELEGGSEVLVFPAEGAVDKSEREALRRELDEARKQGEVYARELAAVFEREEGAATVSSVPPPPGLRPTDRLELLAKLCAGISAELKTELGGVAREVSGLKKGDVVTDEGLETLRRRVGHTQELVRSFEALGDLRADELPEEVDLAAVAQTATRDCAAAAQRSEVTIVVRPSEPTYLRAGRKTLTSLVRELVTHAVTASTRGTTVTVAVDRAGILGPRLLVDDSGAPLPAPGRRAFLLLETHAGAYGRPSGLPIFLAAELAGCLGAMLELADAPSGGLRVAVTFAKS